VAPLISACAASYEPPLQELNQSAVVVRMERMSALNIPTLLLTGSETASPQLKQAISGVVGFPTESKTSR
jgi:hypothetical protein